jgi:hypothetical protein
MVAIRNLSVLALTALVACQGPQGEVGSTGPAGVAGEKGESGIDGQNGNDGQDLATPVSAIAAVFPDTLHVGRSSTVRIIGYFTNFSSETTVSFGDGVTVDSVVAANSVGLVVAVTVADDAATGARNITVTTGDEVVSYGKDGAQVWVAPTMTVTPAELVAGGLFDVIIETTAEQLLSPTLDTDNCAAVTVTAAARVSASRYRVEGRVHVASALGACSFRLVQDADTDYTVIAGGDVIITAPVTTGFNDEGQATANVVPDAPVAYVLFQAEAGSVVAFRHLNTEDENDANDGTGPAFAVYSEGDIEAIVAHDGSDRWVEVYNAEARTLLIAVNGGEDIGDEGLDFTLVADAFQLGTLAVGEPTQGAILPPELGRGAWYSLTLTGASMVDLTVVATEELDLQPWVKVWVNGDTVVDAADGFEGVALPPGSSVIRIGDADAGAEDFNFAFIANLVVDPIGTFDENGQSTGTLSAGATTAVFLAELEAGKVTSIAVSGAETLTVRAAWLVNTDNTVTTSNPVLVPSADGGSLLIFVTNDGEIIDDIALTLQTTVVEPAAYSFDEANTGSAEPTAWFMGTVEEASAYLFEVTAGNAEHLQTEMAVYNGGGFLRAGASASSIVGGVDGTFFISVGDADVQADQDQSFTLGQAELSPTEAKCALATVVDVAGWADGDTFTAEGSTTEGTNLFEGSCGSDRANEDIFAVTVGGPAILDTYLDGNFDTVMWLRTDCLDADSELVMVSVDRWGNPETGATCNDDGSDWDENGIGVRSGMPGIALPEAGTYYIFVDGYAANTGDYTLNVRLRTPAE